MTDHDGPCIFPCLSFSNCPHASFLFFYFFLVQPMHTTHASNSVYLCTHTAAHAGSFPRPPVFFPIFTSPIRWSRRAIASASPRPPWLACVSVVSCCGAGQGRRLNRQIKTCTHHHHHLHLSQPARHFFFNFNFFTHRVLRYKRPNVRRRMAAPVA